MPTIAIIYATTEGQTRKIAKAARNHFLELHWATRLFDAADRPGADVLDGADAALLAGSLHAHHYQKALAHFAKDNAARLNAMPTAFCAVSLSAMGDEEEKEGAERCARKFFDETGWSPGAVHHAAGALMFAKYDFFRAWIVKRIAQDRGLPSESGDDYEFTDWTALNAFCDDFALSVAPPA